MKENIDKLLGNNENVLLKKKENNKIQHIDNISAQKHPDIGNAYVTPIAQHVLDYDPEALIWQDSPSLATMIPSIIKWLFIFIIWFLIQTAMQPIKSNFKNAEAMAASAPTAQPIENKQSKKHQKNTKHSKKAAASIQENESTIATQNTNTPEKNDDTWYKIVFWSGVIVFTFQIFVHIESAMQIKCTKYRMTSQRLTIQSGILSKNINSYEIHNLGSGQIYSPFTLRIFGVSNLYISGLWLIGIKNAEAVRDLMRNAGQIEASRMEKARFR
ncbi:PH domain-containing protein [Aquitalea magnusonii]|uniref:PH (Pleckstrin Homology) domain-containing protein n=1 Tax=Aquitalea magnusonii TaxID=332411 RepID=A0A318JMG1_9NEIS|nr:PH domain-containing protein [Aquitalea magnusonii]PXX51111.1 PH (Pleckstrin Homology) domain-containing protein [Aquitalea magnusonii]